MAWSAARFGAGFALAVWALAACSSGSHADPKAFCTASSQALQLGSAIQSLSVDNTAAVQAKVHAAAQAADTAAGKAPSEIRSSAQALAKALDTFDQQVAAAKDAPALTTAFNSYTTAAGALGDDSSKVVDWVSRNCPATPGLTTTSVVTTSTTSTTTAPSTSRATSSTSHTGTTRSTSTTR